MSRLVVKNAWVPLFLKLRFLLTHSQVSRIWSTVHSPELFQGCLSAWNFGRYRCFFKLFYLFLFHLSFYYISYSWKLQHTLTNLFLFCFFSLNLLLYFEYSHNLSFCSYFQKIFIKIFEIMHFSRTTLYIFNSWKLQHILSQIIIYSFVSIFQKILFCEISNFSRIYIYIKITISLYFLVKNLLFLKTLLLSCIYTFFIIRFL